MFDEKRRKMLADLLLAAGLIALAAVVIRQAFFLLFPVVLGFLFSEGIRKSMRVLRPVPKWIERVLTVLVLMIFFALLLLFSVLALNRLLDLAGRMSETFGAVVERLLQTVPQTLSLWEEKLGRLLHRDLHGVFGNALTDFAGEALRRLAGEVPEWLGGLLQKLPRFLLGLVIFILAAFCFSCDRGALSKSVLPFVSEEKKARLRRAEQNFCKTLGKMLRAYAVLFLITFAELLAGFLILRLPHAAVAALGVALVDILPVFGCGTVLVPWSAVLFLTGSPGRGGAILALYLIITVIRQFLEPRIVGNAVGLHPVLSLVLTVAGLWWCGVPGMILLPLTAACLLPRRDGD